VAVEVRGIKSDRTPGEQWLVALAASAAFATPFRGDPLSAWQCEQGAVMNCDEARFGLTCLRRRPSPLKWPA
jgi:hypothetical protein